MHFYKRHLGDYAKDTGHLALLDHGAYTVLLDWTYATERPLPVEKEALYRICRATKKFEQASVDRVVAEFFPVLEGQRFNKRAVAEIAAFHGVSNKKRKAAAKRWHNVSNADASADAAADAEHLHSECSANHKPLSISHNPSEGGGGAGVAVGDLEILAWADEWPGELATGAPKMPRVWVVEMIAKLNGRNQWPSDWQRWLVSCWRDAFRTFGSGKNSGGKKNAPVSASVQAIGLAEEERALAAQIRAYGDMEVPAEKKARLKAVREQLEKLKGPQ